MPLSSLWVPMQMASQDWEDLSVIIAVISIENYPNNRQERIKIPLAMPKREMLDENPVYCKKAW